jgi:hypothetical protein
VRLRVQGLLPPNAVKLLLFVPERLNLGTLRKFLNLGIYGFRNGFVATQVVWKRSFLELRKKLFMLGVENGVTSEHLFVESSFHFLIYYFFIIFMLNSFFEDYINFLMAFLQRRIL